jgi:predicted PurR-regulated permease PerM
MASMIAVVIVGLVLMIPFVTSEISRFVKVLPDTADALQARLRDVLEQMYRRGLIKDNPDTVLNNLETSLFDRAQSIAESILNNTLDTLTRSFNILITAFGVLFIATYLLIDVPKFKETFVNAFAHKYRPDAEQLWRTLGDSLSRYLAGLLISITFQGVSAMVGLYIIGIPYALILGIWMSATAVLPYIGAFLGAIPAVLLALSIGWETTVLTVILYVVVNQIDSNFVTPRVQGTAVRVHPVLIFISVIGGSEILGPLGAILAVPMLAVIRVLAEFFWVRLRVDDEEQETLLVAMSGSEMDVIDDDLEVKVDLERDDGPPTVTATVPEDQEPESGDATTEVVVSRQDDEDSSTNGEPDRQITIKRHAPDNS